MARWAARRPDTVAGREFVRSANVVGAYGHTPLQPRGWRRWCITVSCAVGCLRLSAPVRDPNSQLATRYPLAYSERHVHRTLPFHRLRSTSPAPAHNPSSTLALR